MIRPEKAAFFDKMDELGLALTFDDVRLRTASGQAGPLPEDIDLNSRFSRNVDLRIPFVSAAMDTVTTADMAIAMAKLGGLGVVHAGLSIENQKDEVRRVKYHLSGLIEKPICFGQERSLESILNECQERRLEFRTFPVVDNENKFVGLLTQNDFDLSIDMSQLASQAMTPVAEITTVPGTVDVQEAYRLMIANKKKTLPLLDDEGKVAGLYVFSDVRRIINGDAAQYNVDGKGRLRVAAALPTDHEALDRARAMIGKNGSFVDVLVIDSADGDSFYAFETLSKLKEEFPDIDVVVGNISEGASALALAQAGADGIKVGQGPGSICTTRVETGIGMPQVTAVYDVAKALDGLDVPICADGGIRNHGDISIAIAAGAHSVMMGSVLAGTKETPGEVLILEDGARVKVYRGMGSPSALKDSSAARKRYQEAGDGVMLAEGVESQVPFKGSVVDVVELCAKALSKSMRYVKAPDIQSHRQETRFRRITNAGLVESHPHDVRIVQTSQ